MVEREGRRIPIVVPSQKDEQHITHRSLCALCGKNNSFSSGKAYSEEKLEMSYRHRGFPCIAL